MIKHINIVSFDVPYPANYGGVIDVYYKIKALHQNGIKVYLHCFYYGREKANELEAICEKVYYYKRKTGILNALSSLPYNVKSRITEELATNLLLNDYPILFEVLHTCYLMKDDRFKNRFKIYRHSNIEHEYYYHLAKSERKKIKKFYLKKEAKKLENFESVLKDANLILAVNENDLSYFKKNYPTVPSYFVPSFHANEEINIKSGKGDYILYNGNLSVSENYLAAEWLINNVLSKVDFPVIIAGLNPPLFLYELARKHKNIQLLANVSDTEIANLIANAQIHTLYTEQGTGLKLKLINALFSGRHIICNDKMIEGTSLITSIGLSISNTPAEFIRNINQLKDSPTTALEIEARSEMIKKFSNKVNAEKLIQLIK